jgi:hypothetical protein
MKRLLLVLLLIGGCSGGALEASARDGGQLRPAAKGVKIGEKGKDYVLLKKPFFVGQILAPGVRQIIGLPGGIYRVKFEDNDGYYLPAPKHLADLVQGEASAFDGGLFVRKRDLRTYYLYTQDDGGLPVQPSVNLKLPYNEFNTLLKQ